MRLLQKNCVRIRTAASASRVSADAMVGTHNWHQALWASMRSDCSPFRRSPLQVAFGDGCAKSGSPLKAGPVR